MDEEQEVDLPEAPGPYVVPLDLEAKEALDQVVQHRLDNLLRAAGRHPAAAAGPDPEVLELRQQLAALQAQVTALTAAATPATKGKGA
jgi:hypothetical protein